MADVVVSIELPSQDFAVESTEKKAIEVKQPPVTASES